MSQMDEIRSVCVYCGSRFGALPDYREAAAMLGTAIAEHGLSLVYGGGSVGLMGVTATSASQKGGYVVGIIPEHLDKIEVTQHGLSELHITHNMHDRKRLMFEKSDAFIILPGGLGTLDETFEILTWAQLGLHAKPIILLNIAGYWDKFIGLVDDIVRAGFASAENAKLLHHADSVETTIALLKTLKTDRQATDSSLL